MTYSLFPSKKLCDKKLSVSRREKKKPTDWPTFFLSRQTEERRKYEQNFSQVIENRALRELA